MVVPPCLIDTLILFLYSGEIFSPKKYEKKSFIDDSSLKARSQIPGHAFLLYCKLDPKRKHYFDRQFKKSSYILRHFLSTDNGVIKLARRKPLKLNK